MGFRLAEGRITQLSGLKLRGDFGYFARIDISGERDLRLDRDIAVPLAVLPLIQDGMTGKFYVYSTMRQTGVMAVRPVKGTPAADFKIPGPSADTLKLWAIIAFATIIGFPFGIGFLRQRAEVERTKREAQAAYEGDFF